MKLRNSLNGRFLPHVPTIKSKFRFEKNERHKEFDGILRASHALEEAATAPVEGLFDIGKMKHLTETIDSLTDRIKGLTTPTFGQVKRSFYPGYKNSYRNTPII